MSKRQKKELDFALAKLAQRESKLAHRREWIAYAKAAGCKSLPEPPCNVYRITPEGSAQDIADAWDDYRPKYINKHKYPSGVKTNHRVPKSAGGCPGNELSEGNLVNDTELGSECQQIDREILTPIQDVCAKEWAAQLKLVSGR